jgi:hypothetical protein
MSQEEISLLGRLSDAVLAMDETETVRLSQELLAQKIDPGRGIEAGLVDGMRRAGDLFEREEYFIPELLICSDAMYAGLRVLQPHLPSGAAERRKGIVVIGVVEGDTHDIGKNLVKIMLETAGFEVVDLGRDVPPAIFVERAESAGAWPAPRHPRHWPRACGRRQRSRECRDANRAFRGPGCGPSPGSAALCAHCGQHGREGDRRAHSGDSSIG